MTEAFGRLQLLAYGARLYARGLVAGASGNLSIRLDDGSILVTPSGSSLASLGADELVRCSSAGEPEDGARRPTSELPLHLAAYRERADVRCVVHTHPTYCVAWSKLGVLFPLDTAQATESLGPIAFTRYAKPGTHELAEICSRAFARGIDTIVMERHGLSSAARDLESAFLRTDLAEQTAHIEFAAFLLRTSKNSFRMDNQRPDVPIDELRAVAGQPGARAAIDDFHAEYSARVPDAARLGSHAQRVREHGDLVAPFERWWLDPRVQAFVSELNATGL